MLTWAICWLISQGKIENGEFLFFAMFGDVTMVGLIMYGIYEIKKLTQG